MAFRVEQLRVGGYDHNFSYLIVAENGDAALVDPTGDCGVIRRAVRFIDILADSLSFPSLARL